MVRTQWMAVAVMVLAGCSSERTVRTVLDDAQTAMGNPATLQYDATGTSGFFGQALLASEPWPLRDLVSYTRTVNYEQRSAREEMVFKEAVFGGQRQTAVVNGDRAWTEGANGPVPQPAAAEERQLSIWLTPHGFIKAARAAGDATLGGSAAGPTITFTALGKYTITGTLDAAHHVTRVSTAVPNPVLGDTPIEAAFSGYKDFGGVQFPQTMEIAQGGSPIWQLSIGSVQANAAVDLPVPAPVAAAVVPPIQVAAAKVADGVWFVGGGSHHSVVVEFADHLAVIEAPQTDERSVAVIAEAKRLAPGKPVKYLVTTHHHFDHAGGFRTYVAEGATIVTHQTNVAYLEAASAAPATIAPDTLARRPKPAAFLGVSGKETLTDGTQSIEIHASHGDAHTKEYTLVYVKGPKAIVEADMYSPGPPDAPPPSPAPPNAVALDDEIQRLTLDVRTILPIHGRGPVSYAEFRRFIGRR